MKLLTDGELICSFGPACLPFGAQVSVLAFCSDETIDDWVLPDGETVQVGPHAPR